jgi:hypothetical protein
MCEVLDESGYLSVWQLEYEKNRWQYHGELLTELPAAQAEEYSRSVLENEPDGPNRYIVNRGGYAVLHRVHGLRYFEKMVDLYERLASLHMMRLEAAAACLRTNGHMREDMDVPLIPHTAEWFSALDAWDPGQAAMVRTVITVTGSLDVCSVCGDDPAHDYRLAETHRPPGGVDTLRLCDDCLNIRRASGEPYEAIDSAAARDSSNLV